MLFDDPPASHAFSLYSSVSSKDAAGGTTLAYTLVQTGARGSIQTASATERLVYAQRQIIVTDILGILNEYLTSTPQPGWKIIADDTGQTFIVRGIRTGRISLAETIPPLSYFDCELYLP